MKNHLFKSLAIYTAIAISGFIGYYVYSIDIPVTTQQSTELPTISSMDYIPGEVLVKYKTPNTKSNDGINVSNLNSVKSLSSSLSAENLAVKDTIPGGNIAVISIQDNKTVEETIELLENDKDVEYIEPNYILYPAIIDTNDASGALLWGLDNYGQDVNGVTGLSGEDIDWYKAYQVFSGSLSDSNTGKIVGIIDHGVNYNHEDLENSMWDDVGYDFVNQDTNPMPSINTHGTHIAGIIAAGVNNGKGIIGVNPNSKIVSLKIGEKDGFLLSDIIQAIDYATNNGIKIINASWGTYWYSGFLRDAIRRFQEAGGLFITAAMNDSNDNDDQWNVYPCYFDLDNIICVAATDQNGLLAEFSNYGNETVDVGAPGVNILSTVINGHREIFYTMFFDVNNLEDLYNSGWYFSGGEISTDGESIIFDTRNNPIDAYLESPIIDTSITNSNGSSILIDSWIECIDYNTTNIGSKSFKLEVNTGIGWRTVNTYNFNIYGDRGPVNIGPTSQLQYRFYYEGRPEDSYDTGLFCNIYAIDLSYYKDYDGPNNLYDYMGGTSMATPHVVGLASLARSFRPDLTYIDIKNAILDNGDSLPSLSGKTVSGKRINVYKTLVALDNYSPESPTLLTPSSGYQYTGFDTTLQVPFEWNASHDTGVGVNGYIFELSNNNEFSELITGITLDDTGLNFDITSTGTYYWRVKAFDKKGNTGEYSDIYPFSVEKTSCSFNGTLINNGESITGYESATVPFGSTCVLEIRTCTNGELSGSFPYGICTEEPPASCTFSGTTINHGESVTGYQSGTVPYGESCESEIRTCTNGTLSGSYGYPSCTVEDPLSCTFNGNTVNHGSSVTGYRTNTVPYGQTCESEIRTCTNGYLSGSYGYSSCMVQSNGGGGGVRLRKDNCPNGDKSDSYYDGTCEENSRRGGNSSKNGNSKTTTSNGFSEEMNDAYEFAYKNGITTKKSISQANMNGQLTRIAMAKMLSQYAVNVLGKKPDTSKKCEFGDVTQSMDRDYNNGVTLACQLGIMGVGISDFRPNDLVTRAEFGTALSRMLYGLADGTDKYYSTHLAKLKKEKIISNDDPTLKELRGYVMLMLMRSAK